MKTFVDILNETIMKRSRRDMPQIDDFEGFIQDIVTHGHKVVSKEVSPHSLMPTQNEFNEDKVDSILNAGSYNSKPIIITSDDYILDGHHRWKACRETPYMQNVIQIDLSFDQLFDFVDGKNYVSYKEIHESKKKLEEDGEGGGDATGEGGENLPNSTANIDQKDMPLFGTPLKRRQNNG